MRGSCDLSRPGGACLTHGDDGGVSSGGKNSATSHRPKLKQSAACKRIICGSRDTPKLTAGTEDQWVSLSGSPLTLVGPSGPLRDETQDIILEALTCARAQGSHEEIMPDSVGPSQSPGRQGFSLPRPPE